MLRIVMNPYAPPSTPDGSSLSSSKWSRRFIILNLSLVALPAMILLALYSLVAFSNRMELDPATGDPVTYQHFVWIDAEPWTIAAYFLLPNVILAVTFAVWYHGARRSK
jgi:hypothetical protein